MMKNWTLEPWTADDDSPTISGTNDQAIIYVGLNSNKANRDRIVACVNACADIPNPEGLGELVAAIQGAFGSDEAAGQLFTERLERVTAALRACGIEVE